LNEAQEEAIRQYCFEQWEMGLGATHQMVFAAIVHLKQAGPTNLLASVSDYFIGSITSFACPVGSLV